MSVSFLLERDTAMYGNPARHLNLAQPHLNVYSNAPYPDYSGYPPVSTLGNDLHHTGSAWSAGFGLREDWPQLYGHGTSHGVEVNVIPPVNQGLLSGGPSAPAEREEAQDWMRRALANPGMTGVMTGAKTRTKDKYRVVYSDIQRLELEKEFHFSRYITIRRKAELAVSLCLSERQVKIWFQNRRAKERKMNKKRLQQVQQTSQPGPSIYSSVSMVTSTNNTLMTDNHISPPIKEEY